MTNENIGKIAPRMYVFWAHVKTATESKKKRLPTAHAQKIGIFAYTFNGATEKLKNACLANNCELLSIESYSVHPFDGKSINFSN
jgi:hypothetical protein